MDWSLLVTVFLIGVAGSFFADAYEKATTVDELAQMYDVVIV